MDVDQLLREALRLPTAARAKLVGELLYSLDDSPPDSDRDVAWAVELRRRVDAYDAGTAQAIPGEELLSDLKAIAGGGRT